VASVALGSSSPLRQGCAGRGGQGADGPPTVHPHVDGEDRRSELPTWVGARSAAPQPWAAPPERAPWGQGQASDPLRPDRPLGRRAASLRPALPPVDPASTVRWAFGRARLPPTRRRLTSAVGELCPHQAGQTPPPRRLVCRPPFPTDRPHCKPPSW